VSDLQPPHVAHLNDHFGTVLEIVRENERYHIKSSADETGLVREENLTLVLSAADIAVLQGGPTATESETIDITIFFSGDFASTHWPRISFPAS
jgi:predicted metallo-beta-lactamase superfamily hydrolase